MRGPGLMAKLVHAGTTLVLIGTTALVIVATIAILISAYYVVLGIADPTDEQPRRFDDRPDS